MRRKQKLKRLRIDALVDPICKDILIQEKKRTGKSIGILLDFAIRSTFQTIEQKIIIIREEKAELGKRLTEISEEEFKLIDKLKEKVPEEQIELIVADLVNKV